MKILRHPWRAALVLAVTAIVFTTTDLTLIPPRQVLAILPTVLVHVLALTLVVGSWAYAMIDLESVPEQPTGPRPRTVR